MRVIVLLLMFLLAPITDLAAQKTLALVPGDYIRVLAPAVSSDRFTGTIVRVDADTLLLEELALPIVFVTRLDVRRGWKSKAGSYAVYGALLGGGTGVIIGKLITSGRGKNSGFFSFDLSGPIVAFCGVFGACLGTITWAKVGAGRQVERWEEVPIDRIRLGLLPQRLRGISLSASFTF